MTSPTSSDPPAVGRLSPVGVAITLLEGAHTIALFVALPTLTLQRLYCGLDECPLGLDLQSLCATSKAPWVLWWLVAEAAFYLAMKTKLAYLQSFDPQEAYFKAATIMTIKERQLLWDRVMEADSHDMVGYFESWFFGTRMDDVTLEEFRDFVCWGFFDNRNQEHLIHEEETKQLDAFVADALERIRLQRDKKECTTSKRRRMLQFATFATEASESSDDESVTAFVPWQERKTCRKLQLHQRLLKNALEESRHTPEAELAQIMRTITNLHQAAEKSRQDADDLSTQRSPRYRFGRPTADPILGVRVFPLMLHLLVFLTTEVPSRVLFWALGFRRCKVGSVTYNYHLGRNPKSNKIPLVFIHGIGVGPIVYFPLILQMMMTSGRPLFVPEVTSVSAFRPWTLPGDALTPDQVAASLSLMLASHGFAKATFAAHSFGTFWMSYMIKYAPDFVAGLVFLDPVNFCLKNSLLTRRVVYNQPDPGDIGCMIKTDMMVNWSVQRNFSWVRGNLFVEDLGDKPCAVFLSGEDKTAPSKLQQAYLERHKHFTANVADNVSTKDFEAGNSVVVFPGCDHGLWMLNPLKTMPKVVESMEVLTKRIEKQ